MKKYLIVIDMQNDFVTGVLGTDKAREISKKVVHKVDDYDGEVVFTLDTHNDNYLKTQEGRMLPVEHCIKSTDGWRLIPELDELRIKYSYSVFEKPSFGSTALVRFLLDKYNAGELESAELIGVCTDICVVSNALLIKAYMPELTVYVDAECCAGVTHEKHNAALDVMESCQIILKNRGKDNDTI